MTKKKTNPANNDRARKRAYRRTLKRIGLAVAALGILALIVMSFRTKPVLVDAAKARRGSLEVTLVERGKTRLRNSHILRAPIAGNLTRIELWEGDSVAANAVVGRLVAIAAPLLSSSQRRQAESAVSAAGASLKAARAEAERARLQVQALELDLARARKLMKSGALPQARVTDLEAQLSQARQVESSSAFRVSVVRSELSGARAVLGRGATSGDSSIELQVPTAGTVLRVLRRDAGPVATGEPILEWGDMKSLEVVVDVLTSDALRIPDGAEVRLRGWGGDTTANVRRIEPAGFTRVSALGVEEQRVNVIASFEAAAPKGLGAGFGVDAEIVLSRTEDTLLVPAGAVFRDGDRHAVYKIESDKARLIPVEIGDRGDFDVAIKSGLSSGDAVIVYPGDSIRPDVRVEIR